MTYKIPYHARLAIPEERVKLEKYAKTAAVVAHNRAKNWKAYLAELEAENTKRELDYKNKDLIGG
jgi:hypothetical protein